MAFNFGQASGGIGGGSAWNNNHVNSNPVNFGNGGLRLGNILTGDISNT
jgi:hypothetical protein